MIQGHQTKIGLVGCGRWGQNILRDLVELGCQVHVADPSSESRKTAIEAGAVSAVDDVTLFNQLDGYVVSTPAVSHADVTSRLLHFQKPVFIEKPFTVDSKNAQTLAEMSNNLLYVMHNWYYHPGIRMLGEIASSGELGPVTGLYSSRMNWTSPRRDVDTSWTMLPHDLSIARAIFGTTPEPVHACAEFVGKKILGMTVLLGGDPWTVISVSNRVTYKKREVRLHCHDGVATLPNGESKYLEIAMPTGEDGLDVDIEHRAIPGNPPLYEELRIFVEFLNGGPPPPTTAIEGLEIVRHVEQIRKLAGVPE